MGIPDWCKTVEAGFTETLLSSLPVQVCAACPPWDMAGYVWLPQGTHESYLWPAGLLLCIALPPGAGDKRGWRRATASLHPQQCPAQGPSTLPLGMWQEATEQQNDCLIIARCIIVVYILPLNYYVLTAAGPSPQLFRWCKPVRFHFHQWSAPDLHNLMV